MRNTVNMRDVTDRVLGLVPRRQPARVVPRGPSDRVVAMAMLAISATATVASLGLWIGGHGVAAIRLFCGSILMLVVLLRFR